MTQFQRCSADRHWVKATIARARYGRRYAEQRRAMSVFDDHDAIFVHIPKTGGVSISDALFDTGTVGGHRPARTYRLIYGDERYAEMFSFGFVREPVDRLTSAFRYLSTGGRQHRSDLAVAQQLQPIGSLEEFVLDHLGQPGYETIAHFRPQADFLCDDDGTVMVDFVGRFERLAQDFAAVADRIGVQRSLEQRLNVGPKRNAAVELSETARRRIHSYYEADFELFNYS